MNNEQKVKLHWPDAILHPVQSNPTMPIKWHVIPHPISSAIIGTGLNEDEAWADAAKRIEHQFEGTGMPCKICGKTWGELQTL